MAPRLPPGYSFFLVLVEALPRLHAELSLGHQLVEHGAGVEEFVVGVVLVPAVDDELHRIQPNVVCDLEGPHGMSGAQLHAGVDVPVG